MCIHADAIRMGRAEAKSTADLSDIGYGAMQSAWDVLRQRGISLATIVPALDAIRMGRAEAKDWLRSIAGKPF